jgi:hypothetical protein
MSTIDHNFGHTLTFKKDLLGEPTARRSMGRLLHGRRYPKGPRKPAEGSRRDIRPMLNEESVQQSRFAQKILRWVCAAIKPFKIDQLREALAIDPILDVFVEKVTTSARVLKCCSNLITRDNNGRVLLAYTTPCASS